MGLYALGFRLEALNHKLENLNLSSQQFGGGRGGGSWDGSIYLFVYAAAFKAKVCASRVHGPVRGVQRCKSPGGPAARDQTKVDMSWQSAAAIESPQAQNSHPQTFTSKLYNPKPKPLTLNQYRSLIDPLKEPLSNPIPEAYLLGNTFCGDPSSESVANIGLWRQEVLGFMMHRLGNLGFWA